MKKLNILVAGILFLLAAACNKDDSTGANRAVAQVKVTGLKDTINVLTHQDFLKLNPVVENENDFDYYWTLTFNPDPWTAGTKVIRDTLARTKDLNYEVLQAPGPYMLIFNVKEKSTGILEQFAMVVNINTLTGNGWYLVKANGGKTDMDFIYPTGRIDNWIANFNEGKSQDGNLVKALFVPAMKTSPTATTQYNAFMVVSTNDVALYRIDNGAMAMNFDNMFFTRPAVKKPQGAFQPISDGYLGFINDGRAYYLYKGTQFANIPVNANNLVYDNLSPLTASAAMDLGWNQRTKSITGYNLTYIQELKANGSKLQNMNANLQWMAGYTGGRSVAMLLFRNALDTGYLYKLNANYPTLNGSGQMILIADTLKPEHDLMHADIIGGNYDVDLLYFAKGQEIYMMDVASATANLQFTLPAGETVTAIQHIKYPQPATATTVNTLNYLAIATYKAGRYKVYLHTISGTGTIPALPQPNFVGDGRVSTIIYMEQGKGSRVF